MRLYTIAKPYRIRKDVEIGMDCIQTKNGWYIPCPPKPKIGTMVFVYTGEFIMVRGIVHGYKPDIQ